MIRTMLHTVFLLIGWVACNAQLHSADSIDKSFELLKDDSVKVNKLLGIAHSYEEIDGLLPGLTFANESSTLRERLLLQDGIETVWLQMASLAQAAGLLNESKDYLESANKLNKEGKVVLPGDAPLLQTKDIKKNLSQLADQINQINFRLDTLIASEKEYRRRSLSLTGNRESDYNVAVNKLSLEQRVFAQQAEQERTKRNYAIIGGVILLSLLTLIFFQVQSRRRSKFQLHLNRLNSKVLRSQLNPHFIFNALNSIRNYIYNSPQLADNYLIKFSTLIRQVLENSTEEKISLDEELSMLKNYMQLEAMRMSQGFDYEIDLDQSIDVENTLVPPLILQPMIENSIWHGLNPLKRRGKINIRLTEKNALLHAYIEDNGIGSGSAMVETKTSEKKRSLGMQITRERLALLSRKSKMKGKLVQQLFEQGSQVEIAIPI